MNCHHAMNNPNANQLPPGLPGSRRSFVGGYVAVAAIVILPLLCALGLTSFLRLGGPTRTLEKSVSKAGWDARKRIALSFGWFTTSLVRAGLHWAEIPPEARLGAEAVRGIEVGIYKSDRKPRPADISRIMKAADSAMERRGWSRIVGVASKDELVALYMEDGKLKKDVRVCWLVVHDEDLIVGSATASVGAVTALSNRVLKEHRGEFDKFCRTRSRDL